jgi:hypothetical protein
VANIKESLENIENPENPRGLENPESIAANFYHLYYIIKTSIFSEIVLYNDFV